jgi:DNA-3-methyladenine glycosylase I
MKQRCQWCQGHEIYLAYHDEEWGVPLHDDRKLFESIVLDGAQAGLSWLTILKKRDNYRAAFDNFDPQKVAKYSPKKIEQLLKNPGIVRNRLKVESAVRNARAFLEIQAEFGSFDAFLWRYVDGKPIQNAWTSMAQIPARSKESDTVSKDLKKRGFNFVGSTICYAFMQAAGLVNDHVVDCFRYAQLNSA